MPLLACLAMTGCGEPPPPPEPRPVDQTVFKDQVEALDRARAVEGVLEERKRELERELERYED
jgi:hypothetical protein